MRKRLEPGASSVSRFGKARSSTSGGSRSGTGPSADWLRFADGDLRAAEHLLTMGDDCPLESVCFHAQQSVEKSLKAVLAADGVTPPRIHNLRLLVQLIHDRRDLAITAEELSPLGAFAVQSRYPGDWDPISRAAEEARVLVVPFQVNGGQELAYLRVGVRDILASRLHREGEVAVVSQSDAAEADAALGAGRVDLERLRILGRSASADYVVYGSVTAIGKGYSLDVQVLSASGSKPPWRDFSDGSSLDKLIPALGPMGEE
ncbi:MAG: HEPN domain-containing protein, partial [Candidatus Methylomirabilis sp.]|nr:HEPN domain-containing protein [Deltaproteobacteria bacterium]